MLIQTDVPPALLVDFASDPLGQNDKVLKKSEDSSWHLYSELSKLLTSIPLEAIQAAYADEIFRHSYGRTEKLARIWCAQRLLTEASSRARLNALVGFRVDLGVAPYGEVCLRGINIDDEHLVRLSEFTYNGSTLNRNGHSFTVFPTTAGTNSTYWLLRSFYEQGIAEQVRVRLDPFLWGPSDIYPQMMYRMIVYANPLDWDGIIQMKEQCHGQMRAETSLGHGELTEFCWTPRDDGIHFTCEELPPIQNVHYEGARYLHAIYEPQSAKITHFDGALRIYSSDELERRHREHLRRSGKMGLRRKIFRIDEPISREAFSLVAQAFFVWNYDLSKYFRETLAPNP